MKYIYTCFHNYFFYLKLYNSVIGCYNLHSLHIISFEGGLKMTKVLGLHLIKGQLRYAVLDGTKSSPNLIKKDRLLTTSPSNVPALMDWFDSQFRQILMQDNPDKISYRLTLAPKKDQLFSSEFPLGILNLLAHQNSISISCYTPQAFVASKLNLPKGTNLYNYCDSVFGTHPPYWDINLKNAILAAWFEL